MRRKPPSQRLDRRPTIEDRVRIATNIIVAGGFKSGRDNAAIRDMVLGAFDEACRGDKTWRKPVVFDDGDGTPETGVTAAGIYRMIFEKDGLDRGDLHAQERLQRVVNDELEKAIQLR